jgi:cysteine desulfurase
MKEIYLDNAATTPVRKEVVDAMIPFLGDDYGNPSSLHEKGLKARRAIDCAREKVAKILGCDGDEVFFVGSGTESINTAIKGVALIEIEKALKEGRKVRGHFVCSAIEHHAVLHTIEWLENLGFDVSYVGVDSRGIINLSELKKEIRKDTLLVSVMYANNEIGVVQPLKKIGNLCRKRKVLFHSDACQAAEYLPLDVKKLSVDLMTLNGSKVYSMKGVGVLYKKKDVKLESLLHGGFQETGLRAGTENVAGIVGFSKALELAEKEKKKESERLTKLRDYFVERLENEIPRVQIIGDKKKRLPNNVNVSFYGVEGESILLMLNEKGIYASTGSACTSKSLKSSHVLLALSIEGELAHSSIRFSLGRDTNKKQIDFVLGELKEIITKLRKMSPLWSENEQR